MTTPKNTNPPTANQKDLLSTIVDATNSPDGFTYVSEAKAKPLVDRGLIELNAGLKNDDGHMAARATAAGVDLIAGNVPEAKNEAAPTTQANPVPTQVAAQVVEATAPATTSFAIDDDVPMAAASRRGRGALYPFDALEVGQSFHVPATAERPNPAKSLASTVSSANKRYAVIVPGATRVDRKGNEVAETEQTRRFRVTAAAPDDARGAGARVFRVK